MSSMSENKKKKTIKKAYLSLKGLGLFDLIPGVRDLPYVVRLVLAVITVIVVVFGIFGFLNLLFS